MGAHGGPVEAEVELMLHPREVQANVFTTSAVFIALG